MAGAEAAGGVKRPHKGGGGGDAKRKKQYYMKGVNGHVSRSMPHGSRGFLISCDPRHEGQAAKESYVLLAEHVEGRHPELAERLGGPPAAPAAAESGDATPAAGVADALAAEVKALREVKKEKQLLQRVDLGVQGAVFHRVAQGEEVVVEDVVERLLRAAREKGTTGTRHSVRFVPVHATCYAKAEDAAEYAAKVCVAHFPKGKCSYGIQFRSRVNTGAKRDDYIKAVAEAVEASDPGRFSVNLSSPDVVLCVEVVKTQCFIGAIGKFYYELAKLNVREVVKTPETIKAEKKEALERQIRNTVANKEGKEIDLAVKSEPNDAKAEKREVGGTEGRGVLKDETTDCSKAEVVNDETTNGSRTGASNGIVEKAIEKVETAPEDRTGTEGKTKLSDAKNSAGQSAPFEANNASEATAVQKASE